MLSVILIISVTGSWLCGSVPIEVSQTNVLRNCASWEQKCIHEERTVRQIITILLRLQKTVPERLHILENDTK